MKNGFKIIDSNGQSLCYIYGHSDSRDAEIAKGLTLDEARRIASNVAKLPGVIEQGRVTEAERDAGNLRF